ncbi:hypothetical protein DO97_14265 [Neosynechococcus sphagnicola sy1]|uniref:Mechanosensitive ion channel protein MscS n=1 Tax=Neosynechococcus sphagnicola sy1 TaxID=1497020 RepID=A0A098TIR0_9CYAN|nr:mechanosensitive ion channel family protein [Neosynechococcus sphagnicola]KGF71921.1 hypothetical protein DO97_14265 [Neosynechococcus sphagnicola sy1]
MPSSRQITIRHWGRAVLRWLILGLLIWTSFGAIAPAAISQLPNLLNNSSNSSDTRQDISGQECGNLVCAMVELDGETLFTIAANRTIAKDAPTIRQRAERIQTTLKEIIATAVDETNPLNVQTLVTEVAILNGQRVILLPSQETLPSVLIMTVTDLDALYNKKNKEDLAQAWQEIIHQRLVHAIQERQSFPDKIPLAISTLILVIWLSLFLQIFQKLLKIQWQTLKQSPPQLPTPPATADLKVKHQQFLQTLRQIPWRRLHQRQPRHRWGKILRGRLVNCLSPASWQQQRVRNIQLRRYLQASQFAIWLVGAVMLLFLFPDTRAQAIQLLGTPFQLLLSWILVNLAVIMSRQVFNFWLLRWAENEILNPEQYQRYAQRIPTYSAVFKGLSTLGGYIAMLALALDALDVPIAPVLAGAGLIGFAATFAAQNSIKDVISGCMILAADLYAVGDSVMIQNMEGQVEKLTLFLTQIRNPDGELISIPNGTITLVCNRSKDWSRVNFSIEIAYNADVDQAIRVIQQVAEQMQQEPEWQSLILEPAEVLGVDSVSHTGLVIRVWIKTQPLKQWLVGREFRYRIKLAFDQAGIDIGAPQQVWRGHSPPSATPSTPS